MTFPNGNLIVAGGGGGAGSWGGFGGDAGSLGDGGGLSGQGGVGGGGGGGAINNVGTGGLGSASGQPGSGRNGGQGGAGWNPGGGGGGGYFGGGGGGAASSDFGVIFGGGGGAGSSFVTPGAFSNVSIESAQFSSGANGFVSLVYTSAGSPIAQTAANNCITVPSVKALGKGKRPVLLKPGCKTNAGQRVGVHLTKLKGKGRVAKLICQTGKQHKRNRHTKPRSTNHGHICAKGNLRVHVTKGKGRVQVRWSAPATGNFAALTHTRSYQLRR